MKQVSHLYATARSGRKTREYGILEGMQKIEWDTIFQIMRDDPAYKLPSVSRIAESFPDPFPILISTLLSLRTRDEVTLKASLRLFEVAATPQKMGELEAERIEELIKPVAFYRRKSKQILEISHLLCEKYGGRVPDSEKALLALPGVGIKTANLTLNLGFNIAAPCVDCHVHQIANRMGWVETDTPEQTEKALRVVMPKRHWIGMNELLVFWGQEVCTPVSPKCSVCSLRPFCSRKGVSRSR